MSTAYANNLGTGKIGVLNAPIFAIGFSATAAQIIFLRELMVTFSGNELSLAVVLACWLLWTSAGSALLDRLFPFPKRPWLWLGLVQLTLAVVLPVSFLFIRASLTLFHRIPGEIPGFLPIVWISLMATAPFCLLSGWAFALSGRLLNTIKMTPSKSVGKVYLIEAVGATGGGFLISLFLLRFWNSAQILVFAAFFEFTSGVLLLTRPWKNATRTGLFTLFVGTSAAVAILVTGRLQVESLHLRWPNQIVKISRETFYENITLTQLGEQTNFYQNGLLAFSVPDALTAEEATQFALLEHPEPQNVLLIGGGPGEQLTKILAHPSVRRIDYVELDPAVVLLGKQVVPGAAAVLANLQIHVYFSDARLYLRRTSRRYDVIILNVPPPTTAQINRLYTREFFALAKRHLKKEGVFSFAIPSSENFINRDLAQLILTFRQTLAQVFADVLILPGQKAHFLASPSTGILTDNYQTLISRLTQRGVRNLFVSPYYLPFRLSPERLQTFRRQLFQAPHPPVINTDFHPVAYYYDILLWSTYFYSGTRNVLRFLSRIPPVSFFILFAALYLPLLVWISLRKHRQHLQIGVSIFTVGFTEIALEVLLMVGFQLIYGYTYYWLSLIVTFFMGGLALGASRGLRQEHDRSKTFQLFRRVQFTIIFLPLALVIFFSWLHERSLPSPFVYTGFAVLTFASGFLGGWQFPLANHLFWKENQKRNSWGTLYGIDLLGSVFGAFLVAALALPLLGLIHTLLLLALVNALAWTALLFRNTHSPQKTKI